MAVTAVEAERALRALVRRLALYTSSADPDVDEELLRAVSTHLRRAEARAPRLASPRKLGVNSWTARLWRAARNAARLEERRMLAAVIAASWTRGSAPLFDSVAQTAIALQASAVIALRRIAATGTVQGVGAGDIVSLTAERCVQPGVGSVSVTDIGAALLAHVADWEPA